ncbi:heterochromatin protein 1-binding protein 3 [Octopus bimaculoides]|uniref:H15 domain-containing protein n=1 Tax=Octopus bimaculoides TaxID=37653 RepID=A0A0L8HAY9_OCTBM|nr:heterochromatin protein 1-binding protein 3 [Octopus bimaculoides]XP_014773826.1 heterochromatin protein 1-binding protein 3 [Octopus bimaculoides]|eukprot:XP_014773825.1 PREDICTED: heterochromatin protein 1-binding protein 3-like [Octopus bimaculoides]
MPAIKLKRVTAEYLAEKTAQQSKAAAAASTAASTATPSAADEDASNRSESSTAAATPTKTDTKNKAKQPTTTETAKSGGAGSKILSKLDDTVLTEKRKRNVPAAELKLMEWLDDNFEERDSTSISMLILYDYYAETCQLDASKVVDIPNFKKIVRQKFGKGIGIKETSAYKGLLKEKKPKKKPTVQAESLRLKMKDIIDEALKESGNPKKGVRFHWLKQYIGAKYPALRVDLKPGLLKVALERGVRFGSVQLVRGIGYCGFYRLPLPDSSEEAKVVKSKKKESGSEDKKSDGTADETAKSEDAGENGSDEKKDDGDKATDETEKKTRKRKSTKDDSSKTAKKSRKAKKGKKKKKPKHSTELKIEDTFPLAITFMSEPKEASVSRIKRYIQDFYPDVNAEVRLKKALEKGVERGLWEQVTGTGASGTFRLLIDEFNPGKCETVEDMVCLAIVATHEPKQASALLIKRYVQEFHQDFNIETRPHLFKNAISRAVKKNIIKQLSGIGASGTFQLLLQYGPSPAMLAGNQEADDVGQGSSDDDEPAEQYYVRPTKSRGRGRGVKMIIGKKAKR